jgi:hypothetical protein
MKFKMIDYDYEQYHMRQEYNQERTSKEGKRAALLKKLDSCTSVHEYIVLLSKLK